MRPAGKPKKNEEEARISDCTRQPPASFILPRSSVFHKPFKMLEFATSRPITIMPAIQLGMMVLLLSIAAVKAKDPITLELALEYAWTTTKVIFACSPILAIIAVLAFSYEAEETEAAKRKVKCAKK
jgi:hypothetical protein